MPRHIGAQAHRGGDEQLRVGIAYATLVGKIERGRPSGRRFVAGVMPDVVIRYWKDCGFSVGTGARDDRGANIDELLHAQILDTVTTSSKPGVLVLVTGDGNMNSGKCVGFCL